MHLNHKSFSLVELLVALIILSLLFSAFSPVIIKKLKASTITVGSFNNNKGQVITCKEGYHELNNKCALDIENCLSYDNLNKCIVCKAGYVLSNSVCYGEISNCKTQSGNTCSACNTGYVLQNNACYAAISNCKTQSGATCSSCNTGYVLSNNACYVTIANCKTQVANTCSACNTGYVLQNNACYSAISNCKTQSANTCSACNSGYTLSNNACYSTISNCKTQSASKCTACNTGYNLTSSGTCTLACNCPNGTCASGKTTCSSCNSGYVLLNNTCLACEPSNGFVKVGTNLCVMQYNIGDGKYGESWDGVQKCIAGNSCTVANRTTNITTSNLTPTCWQGTTTSSCNANYGGYSGCNRTICNWTGGNQMCTNIGWRLPTMTELQSFTNTTYSSNTLAENGLMFCDRAPNSTVAPSCTHLNSGCTGTNTNNCHPDYVWSSTLSTTSIAYNRYFYMQWSDYTYYLSAAFSVRCVKDL